MKQAEVGETEVGPANSYITAHARCFQVDALERDALEVLRLIRSIKNSFTPINKTPPEILSLIPDYYTKVDGHDKHKHLITLTHVCRGWRDVFTSYSLLWTQLDCMDVDKTRAYIQRSKSSPLEIALEGNLKGDRFTNEAVDLITPHLHRVESLTVVGAPSNVLGKFRIRMPLLKKLHIDTSHGDPELDDTLFNGDLSSLHELTLRGVALHSSWKHPGNLQVLYLESDIPIYDTTQTLDLLESAPHLHTVFIGGWVSPSSRAPPGRIVHLSRLKTFSISTSSQQSFLLPHINIPAGALLVSTLTYRAGKCPLLDYLPERSPNFENLSHITKIRLRLGPEKMQAQLCGPSGALRLIMKREGIIPSKLDHMILNSLSPSIRSTTEVLEVSEYTSRDPARIEESSIYQTLYSMKGLQKFSLEKCDHRPFIRALDPRKTPSNIVLCPNMKQLVLSLVPDYIINVQDTINMVKNRGLAGANPLSITLVGEGPELELSKELVELRNHAAHLEYKTVGSQPRRDAS